MTVEMFLAALIGGAIGLAELVARYRDKPVAALLSPGGLLFVFVNASASIVALIAVTASGWTFGLPETTPPQSLMVVRVIAAGLGSAAVLRMSFAPAQGRAAGAGPISLLNGILRVADGELERKRALSRLSHNDLSGLSFERDHAALAELCCHLMREFDLSEAQRLGGLAAELSHRDDLTDADKLDCWGLELTRLVGERALRQAARRLRDRPREEPRPTVTEEPAAVPDTEYAMETAPARPPIAKTSRLAASTNGRSERKSFSDA
ncbi:hypothetical protein BZB76_0444 [Actinomadura pelletieri DSM 43383]|uniref:Uncharacterized protein n=1 Tax=Actinomadura pelletieri DSM 43383 TaxID=1120940 RepID=A0A495QYJ7_9ACTN|nr:hypothetical protein [Actinomadura pelletieri]RKS79006.1 hypothetical protein BZB76_0444 [Actinomadura pelletieri DSM 43383]